MKWSPSVAVVILVGGLFSALTECSGTSCPCGWAPFNSYCHRASASVKTWNNAQAYCKGLGGELVKINSEDENHYVLALARKKAPMTKQVWMGLRRDKDTNQFVWSDHSVPVFTKWAPNEPNGKNQMEPCGHMWTGHKGNLGRASGSWNDLACGIRSDLPCGLVCKRLPNH